MAFQTKARARIYKRVRAYLRDLLREEMENRSNRPHVLMPVGSVKVQVAVPSREHQGDQWVPELFERENDKGGVC